MSKPEQEQQNLIGDISTPEQDGLKPEHKEFQTEQVLTIVTGHFFHDSYSAFFAPLLPYLRDKLSINYEQAGLLGLVFSLPGLLNPFIGLLADKISLRYFVIFTPAITGTLMSLLGLAPSYLALIFILIAAGISVASFHSPAPAMVAEISGNRIGTGMGVFMAGGELGRTIGPLVVAYGIEWFGLGGIWRLALIGWIVSVVLFFRLRKIPASTKPKGFLPWAKAKKIFPILAIIVVGRTFMRGAISTFLPTYIFDVFHTSEKFAAFSFSILQAAGVIGVLLVGGFSDRIGRKPLLLFLLTVSPIILFLLTISSEQFIIPLLILLGFSALSVMPILLAIVQEQFSDNRALANGSFLALNFVSSAIGIWFLGGIAELMGLKISFTIAALVALITVPAVFFLPSKD